MFGENEIIGQTAAKISKSRIVVPSFTGVKVGDKLLLINIQDKKFLYSAVIFEQKIKELQDKMNSCTDLEKKDEYRRLIKAMYSIVETYEICDTQRRINISRFKFDEGQSVLLIGEGKKLIIR